MRTPVAPALGCEYTYDLIVPHCSGRGERRLIQNNALPEERNLHHS
jgi:hypothetical protein